VFVAQVHSGARRGKGICIRLQVKETDCRKSPGLRIAVACTSVFINLACRDWQLIRPERLATSRTTFHSPRLHNTRA